MSEQLKSNSTAPVFIAGRPRSGTTLLNSVLDALPGLAMHPAEQKFFTYWAYMWRDRDFSKEADFEKCFQEYVSHPNFKFRLIDPGELRARLDARKPRRLADFLEAVCAHYAATTGKPRWGEKTPNHYRHLDEIRAAFPGAQIILTMRDPRALLASIMKRDFGLRDPYDQAHAWVEYTELIEKWSTDRNVFVIQYESVATEPAETIKRLCNFLGEPFSDDLIRNRRNKAQGRAQSDSVRHFNRAAEGIDDASLNKWKSDLTPRQIRIVEHYSGPALQRWGYARTTKGLTLGDRVYVAVRYGLRPVMNLLRGVKRRIAGSKSSVIPG